jgi:hypothetical protein
MGYRTSYEMYGPSLVRESGLQEMALVPMANVGPRHATGGGARAGGGAGRACAAPAAGQDLACSSFPTNVV